MPQIRPLERDSRVAYRAVHKLIALRRLCNRCVMLVRHHRGKRAKVWGWAILAAIVLHLVVLDLWSFGREPISDRKPMALAARLRLPSAEPDQAAVPVVPDAEIERPERGAEARRVVADPGGRHAAKAAGQREPPPSEDSGEKAETISAQAWRPLTVPEAQAFWRMEVLAQIRQQGLPASGLILKISLPLGNAVEPEIVKSSGQEDLDRAWSIAMAEAVRRVPPPSILDAQGVSVEFEWAQ